MPELPEVEVTRRGLAPAIVGRCVTAVNVRTPKLREPLQDLAALLPGLTLEHLERRAKYLIWTFRSAAGEKRWLLTHMGMSGSWRIWPVPAPSAHKHDHADIVFGDVLVRYTDPRRFGSILFMTTDPRKSLPLTKLGCEPWDPTLTADRFYTELQKTHRSIKEVLLSGKIVVGCGNIYCSEALFAAGIRPTRPADAISKARAGRLLESVRKTLETAIAAGGSTLHDFHGVSGETGWFPLACAVYGREGKPCPICGRPITRIDQGGRSTFWCPHCQH